MAHRKSVRRRPRKTARPKRWHMPEALEIEIKGVIRKIEAASYTASTVMLALLQQNDGRDREFAVCLEKHVSDELDRAVEKAAQLLRRFGAEAHTPILKSIFLGDRSQLRRQLSGSKY